MGLFDLGNPLLGWLDGRLAFVLGPLPRILMWGALGAVVSMELYRLLSPQARIRAVRGELEATRRQMAGFDGSFAEGRPLIGRLLALSWRQLALVAPAALLASVPMIMVMVWLSNTQDSALPAPGGAQPAVQVAPSTYHAAWVDGGTSGKPQIDILDGNGSVLLALPLAAPSDVIEKWHWWNLFIGNPAGYLPANAPVHAITIDLPSRDLIGIGPAWLRGWVPAFFLSAVLASIAFKAGRRIA